MRAAAKAAAPPRRGEEQIGEAERDLVGERRKDLRRGARRRGEGDLRLALKGAEGDLLKEQEAVLLLLRSLLLDPLRRLGDE